MVLPLPGPLLVRQPAVSDLPAAAQEPRHVPGGEARAAVERSRAGAASPLLLLVHGRAGGLIPAELQAFAAELALRRRAPVQLLALTDPQSLQPRPLDPVSPPATLVPLLLLPGGHVRRDLPALVRGLRALGPLRRLPFLGSWPLWHRALAEELATLTAADGATDAPPQLLHHPLEGRLAERYLALLARRCGAECIPAAFPAAGESCAAPDLRSARALLPLALAANRLTESLQACGHGQAALPLLARARLRRCLLEALHGLP